MAEKGTSTFKQSYKQLYSFLRKKMNRAEVTKLKNIVEKIGLSP
jgi:hypothetical protein